MHSRTKQLVHIHLLFTFNSFRVEYKTDFFGGKNFGNFMLSTHLIKYLMLPYANLFESIIPILFCGSYLSNMKKIQILCQSNYILAFEITESFFFL